MWGSTIANQRQKPAEQLQGKGSRYTGSSTLALVPPDARRDIPAYPAKAPKKYEPVWDAFWSDPVAQMVTGVDHYDIGRYFTLLGKRDTIQGQVFAHPTVEGSMGQDVVNPKLAILKELNREIEKLRDQLGILPMARMRLGVTTNAYVNTKTTGDLRGQLAQATRSVIDSDEVG